MTLDGSSAEQYVAELEAGFTPHIGPGVEKIVRGMANSKERIGDRVAGKCRQRFRGPVRDVRSDRTRGSLTFTTYRAPRTTQVLDSKDADYAR